MRIYGITAMDPKGVIGKGNRIPWHISEEFKLFKKITLNNVIIMGRKTWDSLPLKPLPDRDHIVLSRSMKPVDDVVVTEMPEDTSGDRHFFNYFNFNDPRKDIYIIGGTEIYDRFLSQMDGLYVSHIHKEYEGDIFFPYWEDINKLFPKNKIEKEHEEFTTKFYYK